jgi:hypothetical protein
MVHAKARRREEGAKKKKSVSSCRIPHWNVIPAEAGISSRPEKLAYEPLEVRDQTRPPVDGRVWSACIKGLEANLLS